jgi:hypothetical protein
MAEPEPCIGQSDDWYTPRETVGRAPGHGVVLLAVGELANDALARSGLGFVINARGAEAVRNARSMGPADQKASQAAAMASPGI